MTLPPRGEMRQRILQTASSAPVLLVFGCLFWAGNSIVGRALVGLVPPLALSFSRWSMALVLIAPFTFGAVRREWPTIRREWRMLAILSFFSVTTYNALLYSALTWTTAINASMVGSMGPVVTPIVAWCIYRDRLSLRQGIGVLISFLGMVAIIARGDLGALLGLALNPGDLLLLVAVTNWSIYSVLLRRNSAGLSQASFLAVTVTIGSLLVLPFSIIEYLMGARTIVTRDSILLIIYAGIFPSIFSFLFWNKAVAAIGASAASQYLYIVPVFTVVLAITFLGESIEIYHAIGIALIIAGIHQSTRRGSSAKP